MSRKHNKAKQFAAKAAGLANARRCLRRYVALVRSLYSAFVLTVVSLYSSGSYGEFRDTPAFLHGKKIGHFRGVLAQGTLCGSKFPDISARTRETIELYVQNHMSAYLDAYEQLFLAYQESGGIHSDIETMLERVKRMEAQYISLPADTVDARALCMEYVESPESIIGEPL